QRRQARGKPQDRRARRDRPGRERGRVMDPLLVALIFGVMTIVSASALMALGIYVVKTYPNANDPARNAPRFVRPAGFLLALGAGSLVGFLIALVVAIAT